MAVRVGELLSGEPGAVAGFDAGEGSEAAVEGGGADACGGVEFLDRGEASEAVDGLVEPA